MSFQICRYFKLFSNLKIILFRETKLSKVMRQMVLGDSRMSPSHQSSEATHPSHALSALFHKCMRDVIILSYPTEITLLDMKLCQVLLLVLKLSGRISGDIILYILQQKYLLLNFKFLKVEENFFKILYLKS